MIEHPAAAGQGAAVGELLQRFGFHGLVVARFVLCSALSLGGIACSTDQRRCVVEAYYDPTVSGVAPSHPYHPNVAPPPPPPSPPPPVPPPVLRIRVDGRVQASRLMNEAPPPEYPAAACREGRGADIRARLTLSAEGSVAEVEIVEGPREFTDAVRQALLQWRYRPTRLNGRKVEVVSEIRVRFSADSAPSARP